MEKSKLFSVSIKDCEVQTFCTGGNGGQHRNAKQNGVRVIHHPSGARGEHRDGRDQFINKREAFTKMAQSKEFQLWARIEAARLQGKPSVEQIVDRMMQPENMRVEIKDEKGRWVKE